MLPQATETPNLPYIDKVWNPVQFEAKVRAVSDSLDIDPVWLMQVMNSESGLDHRAVNRKSGATGLIQFLPGTARRYGTTCKELREMGNIEQLDYVQRYFAGAGVHLASSYDLYAYCFFPAMLGKPDWWVLKSKRQTAEQVGASNPGFDLNDDGVIQVWEFKKFVDKKIVLSLQNQDGNSPE